MNLDMFPFVSPAHSQIKGQTLNWGWNCIAISSGSRPLRVPFPGPLLGPGTELTFWTAMLLTGHCHVRALAVWWGVLAVAMSSLAMISNGSAEVYCRRHGNPCKGTDTDGTGVLSWLQGLEFAGLTVCYPGSISLLGWLEGQSNPSERPEGMNGTATNILAVIFYPHTCVFLYAFNFMNELDFPVICLTTLQTFQYGIDNATSFREVCLPKHASLYPTLPLPPACSAPFAGARGWQFPPDCKGCPALLIHLLPELVPFLEEVVGACWAHSSSPRQSPACSGHCESPATTIW